MSEVEPVASNIGFYKSSFSNDGPSCVEVAFDGDSVFIRDSKYVGDADKQPTIAFPSARWNAVLALTLSANSGKVDPLGVVVHSDGRAELTGSGSSNEQVELQYTAREWDAFIKGVADGEFDCR